MNFIMKRQGVRLELDLAFFFPNVIAFSSPIEIPD